MEANTRQIERVFDRLVQYQVPLFQRPYVWTQKDHWDYLWEDIRGLLDRHLQGLKVNPHFLGAVVLEQTPSESASVDTRQVIDGQQRFTTLQLFLLACRAIAVHHGMDKFIDRFGDLVANRRSKVDNDEETYKVWPTNADRAAFEAVHAYSGAEPGSVPGPDASGELSASRIVGAYLYFRAQLFTWLSGDAEGDVGKPAQGIDERMDILWRTVKDNLLLVVIDLAPSDETQVIFETMNARGQELLPADLIKNFLFRRAKNEGEDVEALHRTYWKDFDANFWRQPVTQGRMQRPRIDIFVSFYLTLMLRDDVRVSHLFNAFRAYVLDVAEDQVPEAASLHIERIARFGRIYRGFVDGAAHPRLRTFVERMTILDTSTVLPFVMHAYSELMPAGQGEFDAILDIVESFVVRRMVCGLNTKNYNRLFVDLIKALDRGGGVTAVGVLAYLSEGDGESVRFPDDDEFRHAVLEERLYAKRTRPRLRMLLEAIDAALQDPKSERLSFDRLTIEHVMPQAWQTHWALPEGRSEDAAARRSDLVDTLGNLTLVTGSLNPSMSNAAWSEKRPGLIKHSRLNLTKYFHDAHAEHWDEAAILARAEAMFGTMRRIWRTARG